MSCKTSGALFFVFLTLVHTVLSQQNCTFGASVVHLNQYYEGIEGLFGSSSITIDMNSTLPSILSNSVVMIIQMQGGIIDNSDTISYGDGTSGSGSRKNDAGFYEFNIVESLSILSGTIFTLILRFPLENSYLSDGNSSFQVLTVPLCDQVSFSDTDVQSIPWNGKTGGVISLLAFGTIEFGDSVISASSHGFRGAPDYDSPLTQDPPVPTTFYASTIMETARTGFKGEGYIGFPTIDNITTNYPSSMDCASGAPGNAGGGGNSIDSGGGGGGNGGKGGKGGNSTQKGMVVLGGLGGAATLISPQRLFLGLFITI